MKINLRRPEWSRSGAVVQRAALSVAVVLFLAFFFYRSLFAVPALGWIGVLVYRNRKRQEEKKRQRILSNEFRECILAVATLLQAGYSSENAFLECRRDMVLLFGERGMICEELKLLQRGLGINIALEELLMDMAERTRSPDILQFAHIFGVAKRSGGNMSEIIRNTADIIGKRIETTQEIETLISGKRMELMVMRMMPFGILLYVEVGNPGYFEPLYHNLFGVLIMTVCLALYLGAYAMGNRILNQLS